MTNYQAELEAVAAGTQGWVSLTRAARDTKSTKADWIAKATALGLTITKHGNMGIVAVKGDR